MFRVRSVSLRPRTKIACLVLAWVVWWLVAAGGVATVFAQTLEDCNSREYRVAWQNNPAENDESLVNLEAICRRDYGENYQQLPGTTLTNGQQNDGPNGSGGNAGIVNTITDPADQVDGPGVRTVTPDPTFGGALEEQIGAGVRAQGSAGLPTPPEFLTEEQARQLNAQGGGTQASGGSASGGGGTQASGGAVSGTGASGGGAGTGVSLRNPLAGISTIPDLLAAVLNVVIIIAIPIIIFFLMLAGFKYVTARGNPSTISEASQALLYAIIGGVLILGATAIAQIIKNLVNAFRS